MTNVASNTSTVKAATPTEARQIVLKEVGAKWGKFSEQDLAALKDKDDLVSQIVTKYSIEKGQAQSEVNALLKGRAI
jgi:division protein CdvB (Snf7/Vps24/ESCRT-III family)